MNREELRSIANEVNRGKQVKEKTVSEIVDYILVEAKEKAERGEYTLFVDRWCGDYVPLAGDISTELKKRGYTIYTGDSYRYYITWR